MEFLQSIFGDNWEVILGVGTSILTVGGYGVTKWIKSKAVGQIVTRVSTFFTNDMSVAEKQEVTSIVKSFASRKTMRALNNLVSQLDKIDIDKVEEYARYVRLGLGGMLQVMIINGAFDDNDKIPNLKEKMQEVVGALLA